MPEFTSKEACHKTSFDEMLNHSNICNIPQKLIHGMPCVASWAMKMSPDQIFLVISWHCRNFMGTMPIKF